VPPFRKKIVWLNPIECGEKKATLFFLLGGFFLFIVVFNLSGYNLFRSPNIKFVLHLNMEEPIKHDNNNSEGTV